MSLKKILEMNSEVYTYAILYSMHSLGSSELGDINVFLGKLKGACDLFPDEIKALKEHSLAWNVSHRIKDNEQLRSHIMTFPIYWRDSMENFDEHKQKALDPDNYGNDLWNLIDNFRYLLHLADVISKDDEEKLFGIIQEEQAKLNGT